MIQNINLIDENGEIISRTFDNKEFTPSKKYFNYLKSKETNKIKKVSPQNRRIIKWWVKGRTAKEMSTYLKCTNSNIYSALKRFNLGAKKTRGPTSSLVEITCPTCNKNFMLRQSKIDSKPKQKGFYCSKWCSSNKNLDIKTGKYKCRYCNLMVSSDKMSSSSPRTRCLKCESIRVRKLYPKYREKIMNRNKQKDIKNPEKRLAWYELSKAINRGDIIKKPCQECNSTVRIHGHHDDYSKPLEVIWLCPLHHRRHHKLLKGKGINL